MKSLITITSCNRLSEVQKYIWDYLSFVNQNKDFHFVLALDGNEKNYLDFCNEFDIPLIYSEEREGVGLSKNRVLTQFPDYDYYFFIEDDIELINPKIFIEHIHLFKKTGYHHFCNNHERSKLLIDENNLLFSKAGGAQFAFYTHQAIEKVGGFHTLFAKYKRFGHTEHTYRLFHAKLQPAPFIFSPEWRKMILVHAPVAVTQHSGLKTNENELIEEEQALIDNKTTHFPLSTLSSFHFNDKQLGYNEKVNRFLKENPQRYPLTKGKDRKNALGEYYALLIDWKCKSFFKNFILATKSFFYSPTNNSLKHKLKTLFQS